MDGSSWLAAASRVGNCFTTAPDDEGDCEIGVQGSFVLAPAFYLSIETAANECLLRCRECKRCQYVSLSARILQFDRLRPLVRLAARTEHPLRRALVIEWPLLDWNALHKALTLQVRLADACPRDDAQAAEKAQCRANCIHVADRPCIVLERFLYQLRSE